MQLNQLNQLKHGDVLSLMIENELCLAMYLGKTLSRDSSSHMAARVTHNGLIFFDLESDVQTIVDIYRYHDENVATEARNRMASWVMQRIPYDAPRYSSLLDTNIQDAKSNFATTGFFNVIKFAMRDGAHFTLTQQTLDSKGKGLRMPHLVLLAFQLHFVKDKINLQEERFSFKNVNRDPAVISTLFKSPDTSSEALPFSLRVYGKYLTNDDLLSHLKQSEQEWQEIPACQVQMTCL